jgi:hypothetical protein
MFEFSRPAQNLLARLCSGLVLTLSLGFGNSANSQALEQLPNVQDHDIEIVEPFSQPQGFSASPLGWPGALGLNNLGSSSGLGLGRSLPFASVPYLPSIPYAGIPSVGIPYAGIPYVGIPHVPSLAIPYVGSIGGLGNLGGLIGHSRLGRSWSDPYSFYRGGSSFAGSYAGSYAGSWSGLRSGLGYGFGSGFGSSYPSNYSWARPFGRLSGQSVIQTGPSKAAGNYYSPATVDPTAAGNYYASSDNHNQAAPKPRNQVFDKDYSDFGSYNRSKSSSFGNSDHTKPQRNYWGGSGSPFPQDLNSTPWSK